MAKYTIQTSGADNYGYLVWIEKGHASTPIGAWRVWKKYHNPIDLFPSNGPRVRIGTARVIRDDGKIFGPSDFFLIQDQKDAKIILED